MPSTTRSNNRGPIVWIIILSSIVIAQIHPTTTTTSHFFVVNALSSSSFSKKEVKYYGGAGVGRLVIDESAGKEGLYKCHYDMVLCERIQGKPKKESGLYVPQDDLPKLHLGKVLSIGPGREEENGMIAPGPKIDVGDIVICKNPWGIGPKDEETTDGKKLSFMRNKDIAAVVTGGFLIQDDKEQDDDDDDEE